MKLKTSTQPLLTFFCTGLLWLSALTGLAQIKLYVSPLGISSGNCGSGSPCSLERVKDVIVTQNDEMSEDIEVEMAGGEYDLSAYTLNLDASHSGSNGYYVVFQAQDTNNPPVLDGGVSFGSSGWTNVGNGIFKRNIGSIRTRQLYVNGERAIRARTPNVTDLVTMAPYYEIKDQSVANKTVTISSSQITNWNRLNDVEMAVQNEWFHQRLRIDNFTVSENDAKVSFLDPASTKYFNNISKKGGSWQGKVPYFFENALAFVDADNEWYINNSTGDLYFKPVDGSMAGKTVTLPVNETLLSIEGTPTNPVHHIKIVGIKFRYSTWMYPSIYGLLATQGVQFSRPSGVDPSVDLNPGTIEGSYATDIQFIKNSLSNLGHNGIVLKVGIQNSIIRENNISDLAGNGVLVDTDRIKNPTAENVCKNIFIGGNLIDNYGLDYHNAIGILSSYVRGMVIERNHIRNGRYMGMQTGNQPQADIDVGIRNNQIRYNRIENVMRLMADGGGIYTLASQRNTNLFENYVNGVRSSNSWLKSNGYNGFNPQAIYLDNYSAYITVERNVLENGQSIYVQTCGSCGVAHDISLVNGGTTNDPSVKSDAGRNKISTLTANLALGKSVSASSQFSSSFSPQKAADGNINTLFSTTSGETSGWWQVDLQDTFVVSRIEIVARNDLDQPQFRQDIVIKGSNKSDGSNSTTLAESGSSSWTSKGTWIAASRSTGAFRYVRIERQSLNFAEVRVYGTVPKTSPSSPLSGTYKFLSKLDNKALVRAQQIYSQNAQGNYCIAYPYVDDTKHQWEITSVGSGYYKIINKSDNKALTRAQQEYSVNSQGNYTITYPYDNTNTKQQWQITAAGSGYYKITNRFDGKALTRSQQVYANNSQGNYTITYPFSDTDSKFWKLETVGNSNARQNLGIERVATPSPDSQTGLSASYLYPNPAEGELRINFASDREATLRLYDALGRLVLEQKISQGQTLSTRTLLPGLYQASMQLEAEITYQKIILK